MAEEVEEQTDEARAMLEQMKQMTLAHQRALVEFTKVFRRSEGVRQIAAVAREMMAELDRTRNG